MATAKKISAVQFRSFDLDRGAIKADSRTVELSFSSEQPVERFFGSEILDHADGSCDLRRLKNGGALLLEHDPEDQIGVIESAEIRDKRGFATVRFGKSELAEEIFQDVVDGIRTKVSVGYRLCDMKTVEMTEVNGLDTYRFKSWEPYEISIVAIPADDSVGVGRSEQQTNASLDFELPMKRTLLLDPNTDGGGTPPATPPPATPPRESAELVTSRERTRTMELLKLGMRFRDRVSNSMDLANTAVETGVSVSDLQRDLLAKWESPAVPPVNERVENQQPQAQSLGAMIANHADYRTLTAKGGSLRESRWSRSMEFPNANVRATLTTTVAGLTKYERPEGIIQVEQQELTIADLLASGTTENTTIRFMQEDTYTNAATALAEEGTYAEASWDLSEVDAPVRKIGVLARVTEEIFADSAAIQSYVNARLPFMVREREELHLLSGTGLTNQITGLLATSGIQTQAAAAASSVLNAVHMAITKVRTVGRYQPTAIVLNPYDWQNLKLAQGQDGQYLAGGPFTGAYGVGAYVNVMSLWGLPCISTTNMTQGTALVGSFKLGAQLWRRQGLTIESSNSDASDFANGRIAIRVTERLGLSVYRPTAFCTVTGIPA